MRRVAAAIAFLTRLPLPRRWEFGAADVGRATVFFPLVGAGLGALAAQVLRIPSLPPLVAAGAVLTLLVVLTGAIHLDGLADTADGFGGGDTREDALRIMREPQVGAFGVVAIVLALLLKFSAIAALLDKGRAVPYLILAPALSRWALVPLGKFVPYARREGAGLGAAITEHVGWIELTGATLLAAVLCILTAGPPGLVCWVAVAVGTTITGRICRGRIGGVTGDTLGANTEVCETVALLIGALM